MSFIMLHGGELNLNYWNEKENTFSNGGFIVHIFLN